MTTPQLPRGLGTPAGPDLGWAAPPPVPPPPPAPVAPQPFAAHPVAPHPVVPHPIAPPLVVGAAGKPVGRARSRLAGVVAAAVLAGGVSGAGVVVASDALDPAAGPTIVQQRGGSAGAPATGAGTEAAADAILPSVVQVRAGRGSGSGVVLDDAGHVLTNHHVVAGARSLTLVLSTGRTVPATVVGSDPENDIAVLQASADDLVAARIGVSADLRIASR